MSVELSVITINYNGVKDTCELMDTLPLEDASLEVIVVDNASKEDEASTIERRYPQVKVIRSDRNLGFAGGNNLGIQQARGQYLFFINNDIIFRGKRDDVAVPSSMPATRHSPPSPFATVPLALVRQTEDNTTQPTLLHTLMVPP